MKQAYRWPSLADMVRHVVRQEEWMSLVEAANLYRVTPETMRGWARQGLFRAQHSDGEWWLYREQLYSALRRLPASRSQEHARLDEKQARKIVCHYSGEAHQTSPSE